MISFARKILWYLEEYYYQSEQQNECTEIENIFKENDFVYVPDDWEELSPTSTNDDTISLSDELTDEQKKNKNADDDNNNGDDDKSKHNRLYVIVCCRNDCFYKNCRHLLSNW